MLQHRGRITEVRQFCRGEHLTFICSRVHAGYDWIVPPFLNGNLNRGRISIEEHQVIGIFNVSAAGTGSNRSTRLEFITSTEMVGVVNVTCAESAHHINNESMSFHVLGKYYNVRTI